MDRSLDIASFAVSDMDLEFLSDLDRDLGGIADRAADADSAGAQPDLNWPELVRSGYLRTFHGSQLGGQDVDGVTQARAMEILARACPSTFWSATMSALVCARIITAYGGDAHQGDYVRPLISGTLQGCFPVVETSSGSDPGSYRTTVRERSDSYEITGEKARITNATTAGLGVVVARLEGGIHDWCFALVDLTTAGVETYPMHPTGLRAMGWGGITFDQVSVRKEDVFPFDIRQFSQSMAWGWLFISVGAIATAEAALNEASVHAQSQSAFGRPLANMELIQNAIAQMRMEISAARLLAHRCAWHGPTGALPVRSVAILKTYATEMATRVLGHAIQIHGSRAITDGHPVEQMYRDVPMSVIGGFASNRLRELVAEDLGMPPIYREFDWLASIGLNQDPFKGPTP